MTIDADELYDAVCQERDELLEKIEKMRADLEQAAGELALPVPEPGTDMAKLMQANILLRRENEKLRHEAVDARRKVGAEVIESLMPVNRLTNAMPSRYLSLVEEYIVEEFGVTDEDIKDAFKHEFDRRREREILFEELRRLREKLGFIGMQPCARGDGDVRCGDPMHGLDVSEYCLSCYARAVLKQKVLPWLR